jgi:2-polyprenyl-6-methoxyphenol hydroxylase-like FAD-dependent oxidoreductase
MVREPILIVGGGFGGLTTALALARRSYRTRVLEGAPEFGAIGYGIQFGPNVFHVFDRIGVTERVLAIADSPAAVVMLDALDGRELRFGRASNTHTSSFTASICIICCSMLAEIVMRLNLWPTPW